MKPYQERVLNEQVELSDRIDKLALFFDTDTFRALDFTDQQLLKDQFSFMQSYQSVLAKRISRFHD